MAANEIHQYDIGTIFEITLMDGTSIVDISGATTMEITFQKPDGITNVIKTAVHTTDGTDGKLQYVTILDDLDIIGTWKKQAFVVLSTGEWSSDIDNFKVHKNL